MKPLNILAVKIVCVALILGAAQHPAVAITAEVAKKCRAMAIKAHPYQLPGKGKGTATAERNYFDDCVAKGGNMPDDTKGAATATPAQGNSPAQNESTSSPPATPK
jgi:hypothetical protein